MHRRSISAYARLFVLAVCIGLGLAIVIANIGGWGLEDMDAYWNAALRVRAGQPLYPPGVVETAPDTYRYAPWLAWAWIPATYLSKQAVQIVWSAFLVIGLVVALIPLARYRTSAAICLAALLGGLLFKTASTGNIHVLIIAVLVHGIPRRSAPLFVGLAASLKIVPLAYIVLWAGRGQWGRAIASVVIAAILWAPALLSDLSSYPAEYSDSLSILSQLGPAAWIATAAATSTLAMMLARSRYGHIGAALSIVAWVPRLDYYDLTYLLLGSPVGEGETGRSSNERVAPLPLPSRSNRAQSLPFFGSRRSMVQSPGTRRRGRLPEWLGSR